MPLTICFYEDSKYSQFYPLTYLRPVYLLRPGIIPLFQRYEKYFKGASICFAAREQISPLVSLQCEDFPVNMIKKGPGDVLFLNGRIRDYGDLPRLVERSRLDTIFKNNGKITGVLFKQDSLETVSELSTPDIFQKLLTETKPATAEYDTTAKLYEYLWEMVEDISISINNDFRQLEPSFVAPKNSRIHDGSFFINENDVYLGNDIEVFPTAVIDASSGPVYIGANSKIMPQAVINGPCFIGANSIVHLGKISGSSIGPTSRVGGEVEASIFHSYVNKYHDGFIGHSYVGSWVNFGALTTNSDLKNNYSNVRVNVNGKETDTQMMKVGSFIGDYCRFGIGTLLNTGINIGVGSNLFGGNLITDKEVPPFSWGSTGSIEKYDIDKAIETSKMVCERRGSNLTPREESLLRAISKNEISGEGCLDF